MTVRALEGVQDTTATAPERPSGGRRRSRYRRLWAMALIAAVVASAIAAAAGPTALVRPEGLGAFLEFFASAASPQLDGQFLTLTVTSALTTLAYAVLGTALSLVIGLFGGVVTSQTWWSTGARSRGRRGTAYWALARAVFVVPRGIHEVIWGLILLIIFGLDPVVAVLAIAIPFGAITAKVFSELLDETGSEAYAAMLASGAPRSSAMLYGLIPAALSDLLSYGFYRFECAIRSAVVLGIVGAGGLGFQLALSFQSLNYEEIWTLLYALIVLCIAADFWSARVRAARMASTTRRRHPVLAGSGVLVVVLIGLSVWWIGLDVTVLASDQVWRLTLELITDAWPPSLGAEGFAGYAVLSWITLAMAILAMVIGFWGGAALAFPAAAVARTARRDGTGRATAADRLAAAGRYLIVAATRLLLIVLRAIPPPVWALLFLFVLYPGILPAALALGVYTVGVLGRLMAEVAENLERRPLQALRTHGASRAQIFCYGIVPAATPRFVAYGLYRWEVTIRETVVVGVVGAGGLGFLLSQQLAGFDYAGAFATVLVLIGLTLVVDYLSAAVRRTLR